MEEDLWNVFEYFDPHLENEPLNLINIGKPVLQHPPHVLLKKKTPIVWNSWKPVGMEKFFIFLALKTITFPALNWRRNISTQEPSSVFQSFAGWRGDMTLGPLSSLQREDFTRLASTHYSVSVASFECWSIGGIRYGSHRPRRDLSWLVSTSNILRSSNKLHSVANEAW